MVDNEVPPDTLEQTPLLAHRDARHLVRLVQCPQCSKPFSSPVTLPCGHTVCRSCLPIPQTRANISYPDTPDRQLGIACPIPKCKAEHATGECGVDVTLAKLMVLVKAEITEHRSQSENSPIVLEESVQLSEDQNLIEKEKPSEKARSRILHGGRLASTYALAEMGELQYNSDVAYRSLSPTMDDYSELDTILLDRLREVAHKELDCLVCYNIMLDPTTTGCGHTFCRRCLGRVMDHSNICPICRRQLHVPASLENQPSNARIIALLNTLCPDIVAARLSALALEEQPANDEFDTPLFVCTLSLPMMPTFLHVFEPRYRLMIRRCLQGNRRFGMVMYNRNSSPQGDLGATSFLQYGTLLEIVNVEMLRDGRSFVETRGISRFRVRDHGMLDGYEVARVEKIEDVSLAEEERREAEETRAALALAEEAQSQGRNLTPELAMNMLSTRQLLDRARDFIERMKSRNAPWLNEQIVQLYGCPPDDPAIFPYWFASVLPIAEEEKYIFFRTTTVRERIKIVNNWILRIERQRCLMAIFTIQAGRGFSD
ncbi:hypothetical protein GQ43DRAFT_427916 [Delitschia confertaspora ATCC 74209]|uniref:Uncharacterized protein n=1 Tax=Delitschia confertaspora ATCC 74209 TaxID=1513339 RepID=A0A9P4N3A7_9PLEO|nr:hypothetical protein GQ43DRAFT_427916 [Delitschia confertaspora ATCC 74209]